MIETIEIHTYVGAGPLKFGMRPAEVANLIAPPVSSNIGFLGEKVEYRQDNGFVTTYTRGANTLAEIGFSKNILGLEFDRQKLFVEPTLQVLNYLAKKDGSPYEFLGFIILLNLGITLTGFHDDAEDQKAVTAFDRGRWDDEIVNMKKFRITYQ